MKIKEELVDNADQLPQSTTNPSGVMRDDNSGETAVKVEFKIEVEEPDRAQASCSYPVTSHGNHREPRDGPFCRIEEIANTPPVVPEETERSPTAGDWKDVLKIPCEDAPPNCALNCKTASPQETKNQKPKSNATSKPDRVFECSFCGKRLCDAYNVRRHERIHTGYRPYVCKVCSKSFTESSSFRKHENIHTGKRPFVCKFCNRDFTLCSTLRKHECLHTGRRPHVCTLCGRGFIQACNLYDHLRTHTGERPYACKFCSKRFGQASGLRIHERIHLRKLVL